MEPLEKMSVIAILENYVTHQNAHKTFPGKFTFHKLL